ncbi:hypothetical protein POVWA2_023850 [Plasmodium ovale wallikeri]|uniref:PIR Superfamily Protein n=1 Tax=Plasmodium ovale wallikeri TaxID=864142 RepID=A0A1A8YUT4_PLAOA|nr:hypothetical protein POVWA1_023960 [Plasmodium ovale wallikeri]SBT35207.1 hypothetical protein POVWA2_023850 [Plasmodium ovale wallikeri]
MNAILEIMNMNINNFIIEQLKDRSDTFCVNCNGKCKDVSNELKKYNHNGDQVNLCYNLFVLILKTCKNNAISKFSVLIGVYQGFMVHFAQGNVTDAQAEGSNGRSISSQQNTGDQSFLSTITGYLKGAFDCISNSSNENESCVQRIFLFLSLAGTFLSLIGAMFSLLYKFCSCFMCCRRSPRPKAAKQANNNNKQLELMQMQMQMQQQQMSNALMGAALAKRNSAKNGNKKNGNKRKKKNSPNGTKKHRRKKSKDKQLHIGYQKANE